MDIFLLFIGVWQLGFVFYDLVSQFRGAVFLTRVGSFSTWCSLGGGVPSRSFRSSNRLKRKNRFNSAFAGPHEWITWPSTKIVWHRPRIFSNRFEMGVVSRFQCRLCILSWSGRTRWGRTMFRSAWIPRDSFRDVLRLRVCSQSIIGYFVSCYVSSRLWSKVSRQDLVM